MFSVFFSNNALKFLRKAEPKLRNRVHELVDILQTEPIPAKTRDVLKLAGQDGFYRVRLSSYRVKYYVDWNGKKIKILEVERRDETTYG